MEIKSSYNCSLEFKLKGDVHYIFSYIAKKSGKTLEEVMVEALNNHTFSIKDLCDEDEVDDFIVGYCRVVEKISYDTWVKMRDDIHNIISENLRSLGV